MSGHINILLLLSVELKTAKCWTLREPEIEPPDGLTMQGFSIGNRISKIHGFSIGNQISKIALEIGFRRSRALASAIGFRKSMALALERSRFQIQVPSSKL